MLDLSIPSENKGYLSLRKEESMKKVAVIYGGMSTEHDVSMVSGKNIADSIDKSKYRVYPVIITKEGNWLDEKNKEIRNIIQYLKDMDVVFPVLHGLYGEDGTVQGMLEMNQIPYVGCKVLASSICMDKVYTKIVLEKAGINQAKYIYLKNENTYVDENFDEIKLENDEIIKLVEEKLKFPVFVKPSNSGSSVGVSKASNGEELIKAIENASAYDKKILIEEAIVGKEVECAVLGNSKPEASTVGQILSAEEFYSYDSKYKNTESKTIIPADISEEKINEIRKLAVKAFKAVDGSGLARVDFFVENGTDKVYINEINTMPGFTSISMYPKLWEEAGISASELTDKLIQLALN